jgi:hypothetical protein
MSFLVGRDGNISLFRVGTLVAVVGILMIVGGVAAFFLDQNSYKSPLDIEPYPGAQEWGTVRETGASRRLVFRIQGASPEEVAAYYSQKLQAFAGSEESCKRVPAEGEVAGAGRNSSVVPYWYTCLFQRTGLRASQTTTVTIQPGVFNTNPDLDTRGLTVVEHNQRWQP